MRHRMKDLKNAVEKAVKKIPSGLKETDAEAFHLIRSFISLAKRTVEIYERKKKIVHKLDYDDLIRYTFDALNKPDSPARQHFNDSLRAILVDEFQDTNATQARLVASLAGAKTRLFLIGDDKQSIYKFQGADVSNFNEWKNALCGSPSSVTIDFLQGQKNVIPLNKSFRSHPDLVNGVNAIFAELLDPGADPQIYRASFESLNAHPHYYYYYLKNSFKTECRGPHSDEMLRRLLTMKGDSMKILCDREKLAAAFQTAALFAPSRSPKPILQNVKLEVAKTGAIFMATDMEVGVRIAVEGVDVTKEGSAILPLANFGAILRESSDEKLQIEVTSKGTVIKGERSEFKLTSEDPAEFPAVAAFEEKKSS